MKRFLLIAGAAVLLMTSCSEEKFLNEPGTQQGANDGDGAISFMATKPNQSRATTYGLENLTSNFGVFGVKANDRDDVSNNYDYANHTNNPVLVFDNYLVGYYKTYPLNKDNGGTTETGGTPSTVFTSDWYYEGLGTSEYNYTGFADALKSAHKNQYLKYWDGSKAFTYFVAYTPYENVIDNDDSSKTTVPTLNFSTNETPAGDGIFDSPSDIIFELDCPKVLDVNATEPFMVAAKQELNSAHVALKNTKPVSLKFNRFQPQIRIAFYEVIKGYKVQMIQERDKASELHGVTAMPYDAANTTDNYKGKLPLKRKAKVLVVNPSETDADEDLTCLIRYKATEDGTDDDDYSYLDFDIREVRLNGPLGDKTDYLWEERSNKAFSPTVYNVFPSNVTTDAVGNLQFAISFKLIAEDTGEEIEVRNARVNVDAKYVTWEENCLYTYIFKITKDTNGTTGPKPTTSDPTLPETPDPNPALYPIVFDNLTVTKFDNEESYEYTLYDAGNPTATDDPADTFIFKSGADAKDFAEVKVGATLNLKADYFTDLYKDNTKKPGAFTFTPDNADIATVDGNGVVTGVTPGATTIHVYYEKDTDEEVRDAIIVYVTMDNKFLSNAKWNFGINQPVKLDNLRSDDTTDSSVTVKWYLYDETVTPHAFAALDLATTTPYTYDNTTGTIAFNKADRYFCKAEKTVGGTTTTDYFFVIVENNKILNASTKPVYTTTTTNLNDLLATGKDAARATWYIDGVNVTDPALDATKFDYKEIGSAKNLKIIAAGTYLIKMEYAGDPTVTEYLTITATVAP